MSNRKSKHKILEIRIFSVTDKKIFFYLLGGLLLLDFKLKADACSANTNSCQNQVDACKLLRNGTDDLCVALQKRIQTAKFQTIEQRRCDCIENSGNGDEIRVPKFAANFTKTLEHDQETGLLTVNGQAQYLKLVKAIQSGLQIDYNNINLAPQSRLLTSPQGSATFSLVAADSSLFRLPPFPILSSKEAAAQQIEVYLQAIARDVIFSEYGTGQGSDKAPFGSITNTAAAILNRLGAAYLGPRNPSTGLVDASVLFRANSKASTTGPYVSQFALLPIDRIFPGGIGANNISPISKLIFNQVWAIGSQREFGVSFADFVAIQNGVVPKQYVQQDFSTDKRYFITGRDLANYWHTDTPYESFFFALYNLLSNGFPFSQFLPYYNGAMKSEAGFVNMHVVDGFGLLGIATYEALKTVWAQKWRAHRTLRPEAFGGLVHRAVVTGVNEFNLDSSLFDPELLALIIANNRKQAQIPFSGYTEVQASTFLLSQVYPEASPTHPSYAQGHATVAGALITVLKAFFVNDEKIKNHVTPVVPDPLEPSKLIPLTGPDADILTVAGELDKLASNQGESRDFAGIHYRADLDNGIQLGELVGLSVLQSLGCMYTEQKFNGFKLTLFDGRTVRVTPRCVEVIS